LERCREKSVVVVDEADFLEDFDFLYHFTRSTRASIMLLAQNVQVSKRIDDATYSSFLPTKVYFKEYGAGELCQILRMRAEDGLNKWDDATLKLVAAVVARDYRGDARIAIRALFRVAASNAWRDEEKARAAVAEASREVEEMSLRELKDHDLLVLYAVSKARETSKAYNIFNEYARIVQHRTYSKTAFFRTLNHLQNLGLVTQVKKRVGRYFTIEVDLLIDEKMVEEEVKKRFEL
jgi:cell division control protein 6